MQQNNRITTIRMMVNNATATGTTMMTRVSTDKEMGFWPTTKKKILEINNVTKENVLVKNKKYGIKIT